MIIELAVSCALQQCVTIATDETPSHATHCLQAQGWPQQGLTLYAPWTAINQCLAWYPQVGQNVAQLPTQAHQRHA
jgi:hypothetical protein